MFEELKSIDWANLSHWYGTAEDVPHHLSNLVHGTQPQCEDAIGYFWEDFPHQGSRCEASPALVKGKACTFAISETLLEVLFPDPVPKGGWQISDMDKIQRASLKTLLSTKHWTTWMLDSKFLPPELTGDDFQSAMQRFFSGIMDCEIEEIDVIGRNGNVSSWDLNTHWPREA